MSPAPPNRRSLGTLAGGGHNNV